MLLLLYNVQYNLQVVWGPQKSVIYERYGEIEDTIRYIDKKAIGFNSKTVLHLFAKMMLLQNYQVVWEVV